MTTFFRNLVSVANQAYLRASAILHFVKEV